MNDKYISSELLYADDMVLCGESEEELKEKLEVAIRMMDKLGLTGWVLS